MYKKLLCFSYISLSLPALCAEEAYDWENTLTLESVSNLQGGVSRGTKMLSNLDVTLAIDTQSAGWWDNGKFFLYVLGDYGRNPSTLTGDTQTLSNIATDNALKIYEFWYQHSFANDSIKLLVGLHDYNSTFYSLDSAGLFSLSSFGIGPDASQANPSIFPTTSAVLHLTFTHDNFYWLLATYDGVPGDPDHSHGTHVQFDDGDGLFTATEFGWMEDKNYKLALGTWRQTAHVENPVDGIWSDKNTGYYLIGEKYLTENSVAFFQYGHADKFKNQFSQYWGAGFRINNYWVHDDAIGLGCATVTNGEPYLQNNNDTKKQEVACELTYFLPIVAQLIDKVPIETLREFLSLA